MVQIQALARMFLQRKRYQERLEYLKAQQEPVRVIQARGTLKFQPRFINAFIYDRILIKTVSDWSDADNSVWTVCKC